MKEARDRGKRHLTFRAEPKKLPQSSPLESALHLQAWKVGFHLHFKVEFHQACRLEIPAFLSAFHVLSDSDSRSCHPLRKVISSAASAQIKYTNYPPTQQVFTVHVHFCTLSAKLTKLSLKKLTINLGK